jgi:MFS superfamily sulfate permease-like transporter
MQNGTVVSSHNEKYKEMQDTIDSYPNDTVVYTIKGALVYMSAASHLETITKLKLSNKTIVLRLGEITFLDSDGADVLDEIIEALELSDTKLKITALPERCSALALLSHKYSQYLDAGSVYRTSGEAIKS